MTDKITPSAEEIANKAIASAKAEPKKEERKEAAGVVKRGSGWNLDPRSITRRPGWNPRFDFGEIDELAKSIKANGMLQPIRVKRLPKPTPEGKVFELIDGDRRLTAVEALLKKGETFPDGIPGVIVDKGQDELTSLIQMFEANTGKPFLPMEEATAFKRMRDNGMTIAQICKAVGRKQMHVQQMLALLTADPEVQEAAQKGEIGKQAAKDIASKVKNKDKQKELTKQAKEAGNDKKKKRIVLAKIEEAHAEEAAQKGKKIKMKSLNDGQLSDLGQKLAKAWVAKAKQAGLEGDLTEQDVLGWCAASEELAAAFTWGALMALRAAAGDKDIKLDI